MSDLLQNAEATAARGIEASYRLGYEHGLEACTRQLATVTAERDAARHELAELQRALARLHRSSKPPSKVRGGP